MRISDITRSKSIAENLAFTNKLIGAVSGLVRGPIQAAALVASGGGLIPAFASVAGFIGLSYTANRLGFSAQRDELVNSYRDELAIFFNKDREQVDYSDLLSAAKTDSPLGAIITRDRSIISKNESGIQTKSFLKNLAISAGVLSFAFVVGPAATGMIGYAIIGAISLAISEVGEKMSGSWQKRQPPTAASLFSNIERAMLHNRISPEQVLNVGVQLNPALANSIIQKFGSSYELLPLSKKTEAVTFVESVIDVKKLCDDLNQTKIRSSELPLLLLGQDSVSTKVDAYKHFQMVRENVQSKGEEQRFKATPEAPLMQINSAEYNSKLASSPLSKAIH